LSASPPAALAQYLLHQKDVKVILSARNVSSLEAVQTQLTESGVRDVMVLPLDLIALADDSALAVSKVDAVLKRFGAVDVFIHNGGMSMRGEVVSTKIDVDVQLMKCNYFGAVALTKAVLPSMLTRQSGAIVVMSSVQGKLPIAFRSSYAAAKHAMHGFFHSLRYEVAEAGVGVTIVCPGYVKTNISLNALTADGKTYGKMVRAHSGAICDRPSRA
jgi:dehydrogenase/reductase SDR family protein 7B